tara:strand:- start:19704 stop:21539 length:1836 start_codon:yes stop_codon:yes gene_type:complete
MKKILSLLIIALTFLVSHAKNPINPGNVCVEVNENDIPKEVEKWLKAELAKSTTTILENFETPAFFTKKKAKIIGYIKGYDKTLGAKTGIFYYTNQLTRENKPRVIEIHKDGRFELDLPLEYPMQNYFVIKSQVIPFYLEPGQNLSIILNWEDIKQPRRISYPLKSVAYQGALANINSDLLHYKPDYNSGDFQKKEAIMKPVAFKEYMLQFKTNALNKVNAYEQSGEIDKKTSELLKNEIILETYYSLFDYYSPTYSPRYGQGKRKANNIDDTLPDDYYDFITDLPLHKQSILVNQNFAGFINRLEYAQPLKPKAKNKGISAGIYTDDFLGFFKDIKLTPDEKKLLNQMKLRIYQPDTLSDELIIKTAEFHKKYDSIIKNYSVKDRIEIQRKSNFKDKWKEQDSLAASLGINNNLIYEIIKSRTLKFTMESTSSDEDKAWYWSELKKDIKSPHLIKLGNELFNSRLSKPEFYELPDSELGTAIFKNIIAPYKGKIVVVQFWNPYSYYQGESLKRMKKGRKQYENNEDVVFLNITNESGSTIEKYNSSVEKNGFKNSIKIPQDDYNYMRQLFMFNASVHDVLVAKDGSVYENFESHNMEHIFRNKFNIKPDN